MPHRSNFVHLHVHSSYSLLDGAATIKDLVSAAREFRMPSLAITDHGNMFGAIEFYGLAIKKGVKPIIGIEAYLSPTGRTNKNDRSNNHLVLLAMNKTGYNNLMKLSSLAYSEGFYYRPRVDYELLEKYHEGVLALGACLQGEVPQLLLQGKYDDAAKAARRYQDIFGRDNFYLEVQNHGLADQITVLPRIVDLARRLEIPLVATNDSHYLRVEDAEAHDVLLAMQSQTTLSDPNRWRFGSNEFYFKSGPEMAQLFAELPDAITNTLRVADKCNVQLKLGGIILPNFEKPAGKTGDSYLAELCEEALKRRYPETTPQIRERLETELAVIKKMGFADYFLIVWDFCDAARKMGVSVGPGRGSAAGSIVSYLLRITDIDPLPYDLLFERFLNPDRISMPDIDIDFSDEHRHKVIEYVVNKYGAERVSQIITFNSIQAKSAIRDVGRVLERDIAEVNNIAKLIPEKPGTHLKKVVDTVPELKAMSESPDDKLRLWWRVASTVDGLMRHTGIHAAGVVISRDPIGDVVPLYRDKSGAIITQYEKNAIEKIGLLKMDFLGLKTLSIIDRALAMIKETTGQAPDLDNLPLDDKKTYELLAEGITLGVFQLESEGMRSLLVRLQPTVFEDIIALLAMYRPGPLNSGMVDDFVERKHGRTRVVYPHADLEPVLKDTYGVFLYQEQCMRTANVLANFTMAQADQLRKAMAKKIADEMDRLSILFVDGAVKRGIPGEQAKGIFDLMAGFAEYGFNKSHSAAYALVTYRTAWLKAHYPIEFMAAVLTSEINDTDKLAEFMGECRDRQIPVLPPDINHSRGAFWVENGQVRYGLSGIKGVGSSAIESIVATRTTDGPFRTLTDFTRRVDLRLVNSRVLEALAKAGAMDSLKLHRSQLLAMIPEALRQGQQAQKEKETGQATFLDLLGADERDDFGDNELAIPPIPEMAPRDRLAAEKEALGLYLSGNPFNEVARLARLFSTQTLKELGKRAAGTRQRIAGLLINQKRHVTKRGDTMVFANIEADGFTIDFSVFSDKLATVGAKLIVDQPLFMLVTAEMNDERVRVNAEEIYSIDDLNAQGFSRLELFIPPDKAQREVYQQLHALIKAFPGICPFTINLRLESGERVTLKPPAQQQVRLCNEFIVGWEEICGARSVTASFPGLPPERPKRHRQQWNAA